ncbi:unnamed protein product [Cyprideis torosa]|uniref:DNA/RNA-binding protein Alba-like domain-containing protein n=1 Tax=Cyprideis torosa TaxID=163714 RepID=A0A7R8ZKX3_9CRUS|nr:unnamed protein product [Cyprideis torosa]CAG0881156.1 unnamed protein product [Cyprideis torosa]
MPVEATAGHESDSLPMGEATSTAAIYGDQLLSSLQQRIPGPDFEDDEIRALFFADLDEEMRRVMMTEQCLPPKIKFGPNSKLSKLLPEADKCLRGRSASRRTTDVNDNEASIEGATDEKTATNEDGHTCVLLIGRERGIKTCISCTEILKERITGLRQITKIASKRRADDDFPQRNNSTSETTEEDKPKRSRKFDFGIIPFIFVLLESPSPSISHPLKKDKEKN